MVTEGEVMFINLYITGKIKIVNIISEEVYEVDENKASTIDNNQNFELGNNNNGTKMYIGGFATDRIHQYSTVYPPQYMSFAIRLILKLRSSLIMGLVNLL